MPKFYHGTDLVTARRLAGVGQETGNIRVDRGGGEFGRGFYTQSSKSNALTWALNNPRTRRSACVLELDIPEAEYQQLEKLVLDVRKARQLRQRLSNQRLKGTYLAGVDVITGPILNNASIEQQKFESQTSETLLNDEQRTRRSIQ